MRLFARSRPIPSEISNGDLYLSFDNSQGTRVALIDGAGHGPNAEHAAQTARWVIEGAPEEAPANVLRKCHDALHGTRGAVISIVQFAPGKLIFAGVGNVEALLLTPEKTQHLAPARGLLSASLPRVREESYDLPDEWAVLIFSDGIRQSYLNGLRNLSQLQDSEAYVEEAITQGARVTDDATIVLVLPDA